MRIRTSRGKPGIMTKEKFRFAPSPTGYLHIGGARTALYNYLLAKKTGGVFILRIEDTDLERSTPESIQAILDSMRWLGLAWDDGPYYQTQRFPLYQEYIDRLIKEAKAYPCFCTSAELEVKRKKAQEEKRKPMYDRTCWRLSQEERTKKIEAKILHCIRFLSPNDGEIIIDDAVKGRVVFSNSELDDLIIRRSDGSPTYNLTVVVDDAEMGITQVVRGDDHLNNTPRQIQLYQALGLAIPRFAHVPMILGTDKKRLSKRHGATSVMAYKEMGYLPQALVNYLVRLGWSHKDQEVFSQQELVEKFRLEDVSISAGVFNPEKLLWLNGLYIRAAAPEDLVQAALPFLEEKGISKIDEGVLIEGIRISQEKVKTLKELSDYLDFYFMEVEPPRELVEKFFDATTRPILGRICGELKELPRWNLEEIKTIFETHVKASGLGLAKLAQPFRLALTGRTVSAGVFEILRILGKETSLSRVQKLLPGR